MRSVTLAFLALSCALAQAAGQRRDAMLDRAGLPRDVAREATRLYNEDAALRANERLEIGEGREVHGDVAVLNGPLLISGRVRGRVLAINSDVVLRPSARIDGDLLVVGGEVEGRHAAYIGGEIRIYRQSLRYTRSGEGIEPERMARAEETGWWQRWERTQRRSGSKLQIASAGAYNRVEGLPINLGPQLFQYAPWGSARLDAYAVLRTETSFGGDGEDIGHNVNAELRLGRRGGLLLGGRAFNVLEATERWQLTDLEAGLSAFLMRRDYRDYYQRHGGDVRAGLFLRRGVDVYASYGSERWLSRPSESPWTLTRRSANWRPNPEYDDAQMHLLHSTLRVDTRNDRENPWSGWYIVADLEHGFGDVVAYAPRAQPIGLVSPPTIQYARAFMDLRRYNRVSPNAQLNFRIVTGGWMNGDPLPLQRRFSVDGPGAMPGYDFRSTQSANALTCTSGGFVPGMPGQCDRMALAQVEYRGDLHFDLFTDWDDDHYMRSHSTGVWVFFADAGRGWLVGSSGDSLTYARNELPPLSSFRTDVGVGLDFDVIGVYVAKAMSAPTEPANFFVRIRHRF
ncbi:MAG: BamA/TamA family outer membrane protein [Gemmatimonadaceae bacterium]